MPSRLSRHRASTVFLNIATFVILEVASLVMINHSSEVHRMAFARVGSDVSAFFYRLSSEVSGYFSLRRVNERLSEENAYLLSGLQKDRSDSTGVFVSAGEHSYLSAEIIGARYGSQHNYFLLNRGYVHGVGKDDGVISDRGVIGIVVAVSSNVCRVQSIQNFQMTVSSRIGSMDGIVGPLRWDGRSSSGAEILDIPLHYIPEKGDTVYTSGYSTIFPADIPLGEIEDSRVNSGVSRIASVRLFEDFRALRYVKIVKNVHRTEIDYLLKDGEE